MPDAPIWQLPLRAFILYLMVMCALRLMGKREIGQLSIFDFVVSMMIAELSTLPMEDKQIPIYDAAIAIGTLVILQVVVAILQMKSATFRTVVEGEPLILVKRGQIHDKMMKTARYSMHDLLTQLREKGVSNVADVEFAILETSGKLSVFPKASARALTARDVQVAVDQEQLPTPIVIDGRAVAKTLHTIGRDKDWLVAELGQLGYDCIDDIFYASIDGHGQLWVDKRDVRR